VIFPRDPATGASTPTIGRCLRDISWSASSSFKALQGEDMGSVYRLFVECQPEIGSSIKVSGEAWHQVEQS